MEPQDDDDADEVRKATYRAMDREIAAELADEIGEVPIEMAVKQLPAVPSVREVRTLLDCARVEPRDYLMLRIFYSTGVRVAELSGLVFADVSQDDETIFVREGKGGYDRYVLIDARTLKLIHEWQGSRPVSDSIIDLQPRQMGRIVHEYGRLAGLVQKYEAMGRSFSPHSLRHAFATHRYDAGMDLGTIQKLLGHRFLTTTMIYVQTSMRHLRKEYDRTDTLRER